jgi:carbon storage regulator CsrA
MLGTREESLPTIARVGRAVWLGGFLARDPPDHASRNQRARSRTAADTTPGGNHMLVLTRKTGEAIVIGRDIVLTVLSIAPGRVRIGIQAPPPVVVDREEVYQKRQVALSVTDDPDER